MGKYISHVKLGWIIPNFLSDVLKRKAGLVNNLMKKQTKYFSPLKL